MEWQAGSEAIAACQELDKYISILQEWRNNLEFAKANARSLGEEPGRETANSALENQVLRPMREFREDPTKVLKMHKGG